MAWDDAILAAFPAIAWTNNGIERIDPNLLSQLEDLFKTIAHTETLSRRPWNVDDLHVTNYYKPLIISTADRIDKNGLSKSKVNLPLGNRYKYGRAKKASVKTRYEESLKHSTNKKEQYSLRWVKSEK